MYSCEFLLPLIYKLLTVEKLDQNIKYYQRSRVCALHNHWWSTLTSPPLDALHMVICLPDYDFIRLICKFKQMCFWLALIHHWCQNIRGWSIRTFFSIQIENITDLWVSDGNRHSITSSYNQYLPMPPFTEFYDLKTYSRKLSFLLTQKVWWVELGMGLFAWTIQLWLFTCWISTAFQWPLRVVMHRTTIDVPLTLMWFPLLNWGQHSLQALVSKGYV